MQEIRIHGRGGQGVKTTARILGRAGFLQGFCTQDFAIYGAERRGAPVASFCRLSKGEILTRGYIFEPDAVIVLDPTVGRENVLKGAKKKSRIIVNSGKPLKGYPGGTVFVDATRIALDTLGKPIPNIAVLGGFVRAFGMVTIGSLKKAVKVELTYDEHPEAIPGNIKACERCYREVKA